MNDTLTDQLCAAVAELIAAQPEHPGPACRRFQDSWQARRTAEDTPAHGAATLKKFLPGCFPGKKQTDSPLNLPPCDDAQGAPKEAEDRAALEAAQEDARLLEVQLRARLRELQKTCDDAQRAQKEAESRAAQADAALEAAQRERLPEQRRLADVQTFLRELPPDAVSLLSTCYAPDSLLTFLVQCGQFSRLSRCWEACARAVFRGAPGGPLTACLRRLLELYNLSGDAPAALIEPQPGDRYDYTLSDRIDSDGNTVRELLLPGLRNAGGKLMHKALVRLAPGRE